MSLKIEIEVPTDAVRDGEASRYVANALAAIGYKAQRVTPTHVVDGYTEALEKRFPDVEPLPAADPFDRGGAATVETGLAEPVKTHESEMGSALAALKADDKPVRERGKPSPGAKRRTKEEVAEDLAAEKAELEAAPQGISTGEERVNPEDEASEASEAQDAEDEAAEVAATRTEPLTLDDVKNAAMVYAQTFGMPATQEDGQKIMAKAFGEPPAGQAAWMMSKLTPDQFPKAIEYWTAAVTENPFKRTPV